MCSAPVAVTRRCPFLASSSLNPAESANRATAACTQAVPALILNWINPSLPRQIEVPALKQRGSSHADSSSTDTQILDRLRLGGCGSRALWRLGRGTLLGGTDLEDVPLDCGILLFQLFPLSFLSYLCVCVYARVCIYNNIYVCLFAGRLWKWEGSWCQNQISLLYLTVPLLNCCRQTILWRKGEEGIRSSQCAKCEYL